LKEKSPYPLLLRCIRSAKFRLSSRQLQSIHCGGAWFCNPSAVRKNI